jgi:spore coat protein CotH
VLLAALAIVHLAASAGPAAAQRPAAGAPAAPVAAPAPSSVTLPPNFDAAGPFYDGTALHDVLITMKPDDWETLKANYLLDTYYPADFQWRHVKIPVVGIRSRGAGSRSANKPSLRLDFNRYREDQKFLGVSAMVFANAVQDPAMLNRRLSMSVFAAMELPAPRVVHARLFVNGEYVGLYEVVEAIEKAFLRRAFGWDSTGRKRRDEGFLFEYKWEEGYDWSYFGFDLERYARLFEPKTHELEAPSVLYSPIDAMMRTINEVRDSDFEAEVGEYLYLAVFIRHLAVERFISDIDGFLGDWGPNNFYLYRFEGRTLSAVIPWDKDSTFYDLNDDIYHGFERSVLGRRILSLPALRRAYLESLIDCAATVAQPDAPNSPVSWLEAELLRQRAQILEAAQADGNKPYPNERVEEAHQELLEFVRNRSAYVIDLARREIERLAQGMR